jgi:hypothetical protein
MITTCLDHKCLSSSIDGVVWIKFVPVIYLGDDTGENVKVLVAQEVKELDPRIRMQKH